MKIIVIISTSDKDKAAAGFMYATNAKRFGWVEDVKLIFFGQFEKYIAEEDKDAIKLLKMAKDLGLDAIACKKIAEDGGFYEKLKVHVETEYIGKYVADLITQGYVPLIF